MADLSGKDASQSVILSGADPSTGVESNYAQVDSSGNLQTEVNNGSGASAVNIQDGGNSLTVDQSTASNLHATVRNQDGSGNDLTSSTIGGKQPLDNSIVGNTDGTRIGNEDDYLKVVSRPSEKPTFIAIATGITIGNNKSMLSLLNASGSVVKIKLRQINLINVQTSSVTGVTGDFRLRRFTGHSGGTLLTPETHDTSDALNSSVTARTGATIAGESSGFLQRWLWSTDDWGPGTLDTESLDHATQQQQPNYVKVDPILKPITLNAGEGIHLKFEVNSANGTFDIMFTFTEE